VLTNLWLEGEIVQPNHESLAVASGMPPSSLSGLSTLGVYDVWLRGLGGAAETRRGAYWKDVYGYNTDDFYPFTNRDQQMLRETRNAVGQYLDRLNQVEVCVFSYEVDHPTGHEVQEFLRGSGVPR